MDRLTLPRGQERQPVRARGHEYRLRESESRILATVGTFRVVRADDLQTMRSSRDAWTGDLRSLTEQGLVESRTVEVNRESTAVVVLTRAGRDVLEAHRSPGEGREQTFHAGLVKPREVAHDSQLYRLYQVEAGRIEAEEGRVSRVLLDYELKRDYQTFLNRPDRPERPDRAEDVEAFAAASGLPVIDGHLELPDLRIEYESADGRLEYRDVELVTEHYSRGQLAGKTAAGFALYRAAGAGRGRGSSARTGGTPFDPHNLEWLR
jgi:DNA-binding MarR family transcriptional regulator